MKFLNNNEDLDNSVKEMDLRGQLCPYPVSQTINTFDELKKGAKLIVLVDDPLAIKAIPEELEYDDLKLLKISNKKKHWEIIIIK